MVHMNESSNASIKINMGNSESLMSPINGSIMTFPLVQYLLEILSQLLTCALRKLRFDDAYSSLFSKVGFYHLFVFSPPMHELFQD